MVHDPDPQSGGFRGGRGQPQRCDLRFGEDHVTVAPRPANAVAISDAITPPPMMTNRSGTELAAAASRPVHGAASC